MSGCPLLLTIVDFLHLPAVLDAPEEGIWRIISTQEIITDCRSDREAYSGLQWLALSVWRNAVACEYPWNFTRKFSTRHDPKLLCFKIALGEIGQSSIHHCIIDIF